MSSVQLQMARVKHKSALLTALPHIQHGSLLQELTTPSLLLPIVILARWSWLNWQTQHSVSCHSNFKIMILFIQSNATPIIGFLTLVSNIIFVATLLVILVHADSRKHLYNFVHKYILELL